MKFKRLPYYLPIAVFFIFTANIRVFAENTEEIPDPGLPVWSFIAAAAAVALIILLAVIFSSKNKK